MCELQTDTAKEDVMALIKAIKEYKSIYGKSSVYFRMDTKSPKENPTCYIGLPFSKTYGQNLSIKQAIEMIQLSIDKG